MSRAAPDDDPWRAAVGHLGPAAPPAWSTSSPEPPTPPAPAPKGTTRRRNAYGERSYGGDGQGYSKADRVRRYSRPAKRPLSRLERQRQERIRRGQLTRLEQPGMYGWLLLVAGIVTLGVTLPILAVVALVCAVRSAGLPRYRRGAAPRVWAIWAGIYLGLGALSLSFFASLGGSS